MELRPYCINSSINEISSGDPKQLLKVYFYDEQNQSKS